MSFGVIFLLTHPQHTARLVVVIHSLRKFYDGPITVFTTREDSAPLLERLRTDRRLRIDVAATAEAEAGDNSTYVTKPSLLPQTPYAATLFMDADTLVVGAIDDLVQATIKHPLVVTSFCDWTTRHPAIQKRFLKWRTLAGDPDDKWGVEALLDYSARNALPAINVGVFGYQRSQTAMLEQWRALAELGRDTFLPDEIALQLLLPRLPHFLLDTRYNCAPAFMDKPFDVRIWHFVATSHIWHDESRMIWESAYNECRELNVAGIREWSRFERKPGPPPPGYMPIPPEIRSRTAPLFAPIQPSLAPKPKPSS